MNATVEPTLPAAPNGRRRRVLLLMAAAFIVIGALWTVYWMLVLSKRERTDDAYVNGNKVVLSAQVPGTVVSVLTDDTQLVHAGEVLVKLDPTDAEIDLARAESALAQTVRQVRQQRATARQYDALIATRKIELARARTDLEKREPLIAADAIAPEEVRHAREAVELGKAALEQAEREASGARALIDGVDVKNNPAVLKAKTEFRDAWINSKRNAVLAPVTGYVADRSVQLGQHVQAGQALLTVIPLNQLWVDANFKEVQLRDLRIGQPAEVRSDLYGGAHEFRAAARSKRFGQLDQGGATRAGEDRARLAGPGEGSAAGRPFGDGHGGYGAPGWAGARGQVGRQAGRRYPGVQPGSRSGECRRRGDRHA